MRKIFFILFLCLIKANLVAFTLSPEARISLLTCATGEEVYAKFGHTAIRVNDRQNNIDIVFNYGIFDFNAPNFLYRFVKGETDYILDTTSFDYFASEYEYRGSSVVEQVLNLTEEENQKLFDALMLNALPENRTYRYSYFYDNCSTRPRIMIENAVGNIFYQKLKNNTKNSFRNEVHRLVGKDTWLGFGIDLLIGGEADTRFTDKESLFLPDNLMDAFAIAYVADGDGKIVRELVSKQHFLMNDDSTVSVLSPFNISPSTVFWLLFIAVLALSWLLYRKNKRGLWLDMLLFGSAGLAGCVIAFLVFFSVHPAVSPNYNLLWAQPLHLLFALLLPFKFFQKPQKYYHYANAFVLLATLVLYDFIPQWFNPAFFPLILCLLARSLVGIKSQTQEK